MLPNPLRRAATLLGALSLLALAGPISSASAVVEESAITTPGTPTYTFYDATATPPTPLKVEGTTNVSGKLALRCYYDYGPSAAESFYATLVEEVTPSGGEFSVEVPVSTLPSGPCVLRAVPYGTAVAHPPGTASEEAADPFKGPRVVGSHFALYGEKSLTDDYELEASTLSSYLAIDSASDCGLDYSAMFAPETLAAGHLFDCNPAL